MNVLHVTFAAIFFTLSAALYVIGIAFPWIISQIYRDEALESLWAILWPFVLFITYLGASCALLSGLSLLT